MKEVMAQESSIIAQGVAAFEYSPASIRQSLLFQLARPLDDLQDMLLERFAGRTMTLDSIYEQHNVDTPYIKKNYREALLSLETAGKVVTDLPIGKGRRKGTFGPKVKVTFPTKSEV